MVVSEIRIPHWGPYDKGILLYFGGSNIGVPYFRGPPVFLAGSEH